MQAWRQVSTKKRAILLRANWRYGVKKQELRGQESVTAADMERAGLLWLDQIITNQEKINYGKRMGFNVAPEYFEVYKLTIRGMDLLNMRGVAMPPKVREE